MKYHVLPGDALAEDFKKTEIGGEIIVCRECLIDGDTRADELKDFWKMRAKYIGESYGGNENEYLKNVADEFEKLRKLPDDAQVNLWFEYELFCQANMWFCLALLQNKNLKIYRVAPTVRTETDIWKGFGGLEKEDLQKCFAERTEFSKDDVALGARLWRAFQNKDREALKNLGATESKCFPKLAEVCEAAAIIESRPREILREIAAQGENDFNRIFADFGATAGVYGFGDAQVKRILNAETRTK